jgi:hypothetical protein
LAFAAAAMFLVGCTDSTPTVSPESTPCGPVVGPDEEAISDRFWEANWNPAPTAFNYESLQEIVDDADLIVRGRVIGTSEHGPLPVDDPGGDLTVRPINFGVVAISEVLKGVPIILEPGSVLVARLGSKDLTPADFPRGEVVIFLNNYAQIREEFGKGLFGDPSDRFYYARPNGYQAVLRNLDCVVRIVSGPDNEKLAADEFPAALDGQPFGDLLDSIRALVTRATSSSPT